MELGVKSSIILAIFRNFTIAGIFLLIVLCWIIRIRIWTEKSVCMSVSPNLVPPIYFDFILWWKICLIWSFSVVCERYTCWAGNFVTFALNNYFHSLVGLVFVFGNDSVNTVGANVLRLLHSYQCKFMLILWGVSVPCGDLLGMSWY